MKAKICIVGAGEIMPDMIIEQLSTVYLVSDFGRYVTERRILKYDIISDNPRNKGNYQDGWYQKHNNKNRFQR